MLVLHTRRYLLRSAVLWQRKLIIYGWSALKVADRDTMKVLYRIHVRGEVVEACGPIAHKY